MNEEIKQRADMGDIKRLRYIFWDSLDVDPTFEDYEEEFAYCKKVCCFFEKHRDITPFIKDSSKWNYEYWKLVKKELMENYSLERFEHMRQIAPVVYTEKVKRIREEERKLASSKESQSLNIKTETIEKIDIDMNKVEAERIRKLKEKYAAENKEEFESKMEKKRNREQNTMNTRYSNSDSSKKSQGTVLTWLVPIGIVAILLIIIFINQR